MKPGKQEITQKQKISGTKSATKTVKPMSGTKSSLPGTKLRTLTHGLEAKQGEDHWKLSS